MIFDHIEWDEHNLDHATRRLTVAEIEQTLWNADQWFHNSIEDRRLVRSQTDGGKSVLVVVQVVRDGV